MAKCLAKLADGLLDDQLGLESEGNRAENDVADKLMVERLVVLHKGWWEGDTARFPTVHNREMFEKALALLDNREVCCHEWQRIPGVSNPSYQLYECTKCGETEERDCS